MSSSDESISISSPSSRKSALFDRNPVERGGTSFEAATTGAAEFKKDLIEIYFRIYNKKPNENIKQTKI